MRIVLKVFMKRNSLKREERFQKTFSPSLQFFSFFLRISSWSRNILTHVINVTKIELSFIISLSFHWLISVSFTFSLFFYMISSIISFVNTQQSLGIGFFSVILFRATLSRLFRTQKKTILMLSFRHSPSLSLYTRFCLWYVCFIDGKTDNDKRSKLKLILLQTQIENCKNKLN